MRLIAVTVFLSAAVVSADPIEVALEQTARVGGTPAVTVTLKESGLSVKLELTRDDGVKNTAQFSGQAGSKRRIPLPQSVGRRSWKGTLTVLKPKHQPAIMPLDFETEVYVPAHIELAKTNAVDLKKREVTFTLNRDCKGADLTVIDETGATAFQNDFKFDIVKQGKPVTVAWPTLPHPVLKLQLRAHGVDETFDTVELTPWEVDIPHEEVNFESGQARIAESEKPKLDASLTLIFAGIEKYGRLARLRLFIAGHTDSVGSVASNQTLSLQRASAIAQYFRKKGVRLPLFYEGFGEQALTVETPDEVDEPKNRRAEYTLTVETPRPKNSPFVPNWRKL
jgi:outer membrane protein OmpA-like peptidoglycan-associated protein